MKRFKLRRSLLSVGHLPAIERGSFLCVQTKPVECRSRDGSEACGFGTWLIVL